MSAQFGRLPGKDQSVLPAIWYDLLPFQSDGTLGGLDPAGFQACILSDTLWPLPCFRMTASFEGLQGGVKPPQSTVPTAHSYKKQKCPSDF
jgi:hypothetical protein